MTFYFVTSLLVQNLLQHLLFKLQLVNFGFLVPNRFAEVVPKVDLQLVLLHFHLVPNVFFLEAGFQLGHLHPQLIVEHFEMGLLLLQLVFELVDFNLLFLYCVLKLGFLQR